MLLGAAANAQVSTSQTQPGQVTVTWSRVEGAVSYQVAVRDWVGDTISTAATTQTAVSLRLSPGTYYVRVAAIDLFGKPASYSPWRQIQVYRSVPPRPTSVEPRLLYRRTGSRELLVSGSDFLPGVRCQITNGGRSFGDATVEETAPDGLRMRIDTSALPAGRYSLRLVNPGGSPAAKELSLTLVNRTRPSLESMSLATGYNDQAYRDVTIGGRGFRRGIRLALRRPGTRIEAYRIAVESRDRMIATFDLTGAPAGRYDLVATNPGGLSARLRSALTVRAIGAPRFASMSPSVVTAGRRPYGFTVRGSGFIPATVFLLKNGNILLPATLVGSPLPAAARLALPPGALAPGRYDLVIENGLAFQVVVPGALTVRPEPATELEALSARSGTDAQLLRGVRLSGRNLRHGERFYLQGGGTLIPVAATIVSPSRALLDMDLRGKADGLYGLVVYEDGRPVGSLPGGFTVLPRTKPVPSFISISGGWTSMILLPTGSQTDLGNSLEGGDLVVALSLGNRFLAPIPVVRQLGLDIDVGYNGLSASVAAAQSSGELGLWHVGTDLFYKTDFRFPVNLIARGGWGLVLSDFSESSPIAAASGTSTDLYVDAGGGIELLIAGAVPIELTAGYQRVLYAGANLDSLNLTLQAGIEVGG